MIKVAVLSMAALAVLVLGTPAPGAQAPSGADPAARAIRKVLDDQVAAWNRGDLDAFATGYKKSPDLLFVGKTMARGYDAMVARYHKAYPTHASMGVLTFSDLEIHSLGPDYANVVGRFHLRRTAAGGGDASGVFTLLFERTPQGWKIIQDHTS